MHFVDFGVAGQMEWDVDAAVADENLDEFKQKHCFLRFAQVKTLLRTLLGAGNWYIHERRLPSESLNRFHPTEHNRSLYFFSPRWRSNPLFWRGVVSAGF